MNPTVIIIGAGITGLAAAVELEKAHIDYRIFECSNETGGRIKTKKIEGFQIDNGFQVFFDSYKTPSKFISYEKLKLCNFESGAWIKNHKIGNPVKHPELFFSTLKAPFFSVTDKLIILKMILKSIFGGNQIGRDSLSEITTSDLLQQLGLSESAIQSFFRPFFGGVFLDETLSTSSKFFDFTFRNFVTGNACLPKDGMKAIPLELSQTIPSHKLFLDTKILSLTNKSITTEHGETLNADAIVIATDARSASTLLQRKIPLIADFKKTTTIHFTSEHPPYKEKMIFLNPDPFGIVLHLCPISNIQPSYSPDHRSLISITINSSCTLSKNEIIEKVKLELFSFFGQPTLDWKLLDFQTIYDALPAQPAGALTPWHRTKALSESIFLGGDYTETSSIEGAFLAGETLAKMIISKARN
jgi:hypothetical protein